ncbi:MAG: hypothetical protein GXO74_15720 [Calditrichaeota bacterium]|nr:hypothetical protein [Calditrichota bacterium]
MPVRILLFSLIIGFAFWGCKEEDQEAYQKVSPELRATLMNLEKTDERKKPITVVFRVNEDLTDLHYDVLKKKQIKILANIGPIFTASLPAERVVDLAKMKFVDHIRAERTFKATPRDSGNSNFKIKEKLK